MLKSIIKGLFIVTFIIPTILADDTLGTLNRQGDTNYSEPLGKKSYLAEKARMPSESSVYLGINAGVNVNPLNSEIIVNGSSKSTTKTTPVSYAGGIYGGYGFNFSHFYFGTELSAYYGFLNRKINHNGIELSVQQPIIAGFDIVSGYLTDARDFLFYGRVGFGSGFTKLSFKDDTINDKVSKVNFGLRVGGGMEYFVNDTFSLRIEYIYSKYNKVSSDYTSSGGKKYSYALNATGIHQVNLGLSIHF